LRPILTVFDGKLKRSGWGLVARLADIFREVWMLTEALRTMYGYNRWATERLLDTAAQLTPRQLDAPAGGEQRSVRETLLHLIVTQKGWLSWWDGSMSAEAAYGLRPDPADYPDVAALRRLWAALEQQTQAFLARLSDEELQRVYSSKLPDGSEWQMLLWKMMLHVANHGTQHRSEAAALLTGFGHSPGDLDLIYYVSV
jgi:uncharacterized damage-inducible protein DinB